MASLIINPDVMEFLDIVRVQGYEGTNVESLSFSELPEEFQNKTIRELEARELTGGTIIGYKDPAGTYFVNPSLDTVVVPDSKIFVLGNVNQINKLIEIFDLEH